MNTLLRVLYLYSMRPLLLIAVVLLVGLESCKRGCFINKNKVEGIIESEFDFGECFWIEPDLYDEIVVTDDSAYQSIGLEIYTAKPDCETPVYPAIDFSKHTLLGKSTSGQCSIDYIREVTKDDASKKYKYLVRVLECGICYKEGYSMNWVLVPKLPQGYTVEFEVKYK